MDVTNATDYPSTKKEKHGLVNLGEGPSVTRGANLNPVVTAGLLAAGKLTEIPLQLQANPGRTGTDAGAIQLAREGVRLRSSWDPTALHAHSFGGGAPEGCGADHRFISGLLFGPG